MNSFNICYENKVFTSVIDKKVVFILNKIIYFFLCIYSIVDMMTGLAGLYHFPSPGMPFKMLLLILMILEIGANQMNKILLPLYFFATLLLSCIYYMFCSDISFNNSVAMILRIEMAPIIYAYLKIIYLNKKVLLEKIIQWNFFSILVNFVLGVLGIGESSYRGANFGIKGLYMGGNALAVVIICLFVFYVNNCKKRNVLPCFLFFIFIGFLVGTKVSFLGILLYGIYKRFKSIPKVKKILYFIAIPIIIFIFFYILYSKGFFDYQIERIKRLMTLFNGRWLSAILSGRDVKLNEHLSKFMKNLTIRELLFGQGYLISLDIIEIDFFDTLLSYGLVVFLPIFLFYFSFFNRKLYSKEILVFNLLYLAICLTSGHIWYNTSSAFFFCVINVYYRNEKELNNGFIKNKN